MFQNKFDKSYLINTKCPYLLLRDIKFIENQLVINSTYLKSLKMRKIGKFRHIKYI